MLDRLYSVGSSARVPKPAARSTVSDRGIGGLYSPRSPHRRLPSKGLAPGTAGSTYGRAAREGPYGKTEFKPVRGFESAGANPSAAQF